MTVVKHDFGPKEIALVQLVDQDVELLQMLVDLKWVDWLSTPGGLLKLFRNVDKTLTEYSSIQEQIERGGD